MSFKHLQDGLARYLGSSSSLYADATQLKWLLNMTMQELSEEYSWDFLGRRGYIVTLAQYTTGTVTTTQNSRTVTGSGTTFTREMVGGALRLRDRRLNYP